MFARYPRIAIAHVKTYLEVLKSLATHILCFSIRLYAMPIETTAKKQTPRRFHLAFALLKGSSRRELVCTPYVSAFYTYLLGRKGREEGVIPFTSIDIKSCIVLIISIYKYAFTVFMCLYINTASFRFVYFLVGISSVHKVR